MNMHECISSLSTDTGTWLAPKMRSPLEMLREILKQSFSNVVLASGASTSSENLLEMQIIRLQLELLLLETMGVEPGHLFVFLRSATSDPAIPSLRTTAVRYLARIKNKTKQKPTLFRSCCLQNFLECEIQWYTVYHLHITKYSLSFYWRKKVSKRNFYIFKSNN